MAPPRAAIAPQSAPAGSVRPALPATATLELPPSAESFRAPRKIPWRFRRAARVSSAIRISQPAYPWQPVASSRASFPDVTPDHIPQKDRVPKNVNHQQHVLRKGPVRGLRRSARVINSPQSAQYEKKATQRLHVPQRHVKVVLRESLHKLIFREEKCEGHEREEKENRQIVQPWQPPVTRPHAAGLRNDRGAPADQAEINNDAQHRLGSGHWK